MINLKKTPKQQLLDNIRTYSVDVNGVPAPVEIIDLDPVSVHKSACIFRLVGASVVNPQLFDATSPEIVAVCEIVSSDVAGDVLRLRDDKKLKQRVMNFLGGHDEFPVDDTNFVGDREIKPWLPILDAGYSIGIYHDEPKDILYLCVHVGMTHASDAVLIDSVFEAGRKGVANTADFVDRAEMLDQLIVRYASYLAFFTCAILKLQPRRIIADDEAIKLDGFTTTFMVELKSEITCLINRLSSTVETGLMYTSKCGIKSASTNELFIQTDDMSSHITRYELNEIECAKLKNTKCVSIPIKTSDGVPVIVSLDGSTSLFSEDIAEKTIMKSIFFVSKQ